MFETGQKLRRLILFLITYFQKKNSAKKIPLLEIIIYPINIISLSILIKVWYHAHETLKGYTNSLLEFFLRLLHAMFTPRGTQITDRKVSYS